MAVYSSSESQQWYGARDGTVAAHEEHHSYRGAVTTTQSGNGAMQQQHQQQQQQQQAPHINIYGDVHIYQGSAPPASQQ
jgi:hypothetical protein